jgi:hypothetical protein
MEDDDIRVKSESMMSKFEISESSLSSGKLGRDLSYKKGRNTHIYADEITTFYE